jgi:hypothetical protein
VTISMSWWMYVASLAASALVAVLLAAIGETRRRDRAADQAYEDGYCDGQEQSWMAQAPYPPGDQRQPARPFTDDAITTSWQPGAADRPVDYWPVYIGAPDPDAVVATAERQRWTDALCKAQDRDTEAYVRHLADTADLIWCQQASEDGRPWWQDDPQQHVPLTAGG